MIRTQIQLDESQFERLKTLADQRDVSFASLVREAVESYLARPRAAVRERALSTIGIIAADASDVGEKHDEYLD